MSDVSGKLRTVSTELTIALVFAILATAVAGCYFLVLLIGLITAVLAGQAFGPLAGGIGIAVLLAAIMPLVLNGAGMTISLLVTLRIVRLRKAVERGDVQQLKELNSTGWAIMGILAGVVPGVLMLVASSEINDLPAGRYTADPAFSPDAMEKLLRLKQLLDSGTITQADFEGQKQRLMGGAVCGQQSSEPDELRKLKELRDCGAISAAEFENLKQKFLEAL